MFSNAILASYDDSKKLGILAASIHNHPNNSMSPSQDDATSSIFTRLEGYIADQKGHTGGPFY